MRFVSSLSRGWISSEARIPQRFRRPCDREKHSANELAEPLDGFGSHLEEGGFAQLASWPLEPRRTMMAELESMRDLSSSILRAE